MAPLPLPPLPEVAPLRLYRALCRISRWLESDACSRACVFRVPPFPSLGRAHAPAHAPEEQQGLAGAGEPELPRFHARHPAEFASTPLVQAPPPLLLRVSDLYRQYVHDDLFDGTMEAYLPVLDSSPGRFQRALRRRFEHVAEWSSLPKEERRARLLAGEALRRQLLAALLAVPPIVPDAQLRAQLHLPPAATPSATEPLVEIVPARNRRGRRDGGLRNGLFLLAQPQLRCTGTTSSPWGVQLLLMPSASGSADVPSSAASIALTVRTDAVISAGGTASDLVTRKGATATEAVLAGVPPALAPLVHPTSKNATSLPIRFGGPVRFRPHRRPRSSAC